LQSTRRRPWDRSCRAGGPLLFGDQTGSFYALDAQTGRLLWKKPIDEHESARVTGASAVYQGTVFIPVSSWEETRARAAGYVCCSFRGSVLALRVRDGSQVWKTYTIRDIPHKIGNNSGPSGASVWGAPTLDAKRGLLYATTGDNFSDPATEMSDAVVAMDLKMGRVAWSRQTTPDDVFNGRCQSRNECPGLDYDFGSSAILAKQDNGREVLLAGQKSGVVYALDPDKKGEVLWRTRVGQGGVNGGVQRGMATDGRMCVRCPPAPRQWPTALDRWPGTSNGCSRRRGRERVRVRWRFRGTHAFRSLPAASTRSHRRRIRMPISVSGAGPRPETNQRPQAVW
jgi:outer membrane protein assembly factor BamB